MFESFEDYFSIPNSTEESNDFDAISLLRNRYQGEDFGDGLYRIFGENEVSKWKEIISEGYPDFLNKFDPFGYDWLGRCFAVDLRNDTKNNILLFEIGTSDVLEIPCNIVEFHNEEIPLNSEACLAKIFFNEWKEYSKQKLEHSKCAGYKIPLFLGGEDKVGNLELSDMEVYWFVCSAASKKN